MYESGQFCLDRQLHTQISGSYLDSGLPSKQARLSLHAYSVILCCLISVTSVETWHLTSAFCPPRKLMPSEIEDWKSAMV